MKKICKLLILAAALTGGISLNSCIDLDPVDYSDINPSNFPQTETDIQSMVNSCYYSVRSSWFDGLFSTSERGVTVVNDLTTEILSCKSGFLKDVSELNYFSTTADLTRFYYTDTDAYSDGWLNDISRCTSVLAQIEACNFLSAEKKQYYEAEIRCARGLIAYTLYDMFGPLVIAPIEVLNNPTVEKPLARLSKEEMVKFIEDDLIFAATYLPTPTEAEYGRFSQGLANMLLIRLYLHESPENKEYYTKIEEIARKLMAPSYGYRLSTSYTQMFEIGGQGRGNAEIIWAIPVNTEAVSWNDWHMFVLPTDFADHGMTSGYECVNSTWYFYDSFEVNDVRKTYLVTSYKAQDGSIINRENPGLHLELGPIPLKYGYDINVTGNGGKSNIDPIIYRLADVYLTLAEALYLKPASSETDKEEAISHINTIRNRANLDEINSKDITTEEKFIEILLKERSHELWCENGQYRADLIRFNKFVEHAETVKGTVYDMALKVFSQVPEAELYISGNGTFPDEYRKYSNIHFMGNMEYQDYLNLLESVIVCLNLRNPYLPENNNNFPSKILDYLSRQKIVLSTISYPEIEGANYILTDFNEIELIKKIKEIVMLGTEHLAISSNNTLFLRKQFSVTSWKEMIQSIDGIQKIS